MKPSLLLIALFSVAALAACGKPAEKSAPVAPATEATMPAEAAGQVPAFTATDAGVGPLTGQAAFDEAAIKALFPNSEVKAAFLNEEGGQTPIFTVNGPEELVLELQEGTTTGKVGRILAQGGPVIGPKGEKLLDRFDAAGFKASDCVIGADRFSGAALCRRADAPNLAFVYGAPGELAGNPGDVPDEAALTAKGFLREFLWQAPLPR